VTGDQIVGPEWIGTECFDLTATLSPGTSKEQLASMLQALLAERFGLATHWESKPVRGYSLELANEHRRKLGPTIKASDSSLVPAETPARRPVRDTTYPELDRPGMIYPFVLGSNGHAIHLIARAQTFQGLARFISGQLHTPLVDRTGLTELYDFTLEFELESTLDAGISQDKPDLAERRYPLIAQALQQQLGVRLSPTPMTKTLLIIDRANKVPSHD
jgi:uncharacterized protein (TIGR03435 family)